MDPLPDRIDSYRVVGLLGKGGAGRVYQVRAPDGQPEALKMLEAGTLTAADERRFDQEFRVVSRLLHPNVLKVHASGRAAGVPYFTMEYLPGGDLRHFCSLHGGMGPHWVEADLRTRLCDMVAGILSGLSAIHAQRIVHRDLKPENILLDSAGTPKIMDFGLARCMESSVRLTAAHTILGTIAYMSPGYRSSAEVDPRSDLYSLGTILYEWLHGELPYSTTDLGQIIMQVLTVNPPPLDQVHPQIPASVSRFVAHLLDKDPNNRPPTAEAALAAWQATWGAQAVASAVPELAPALFEPVFVGREREMQVLQTRLEELKQRQSSVVFVGGESGVGKSRLGLELTRMAHLRSMSSLHGRFFEEVDVPFEGFQPVLRGALEAPAPDMVRFREQAAALLGRVLPELRSEASAAGDERVDKFHLLETMVQCLEIKASPHGLLVVLDDAQWADGESLGLLAFICRTLMFVADGTRRADFGGLMLVVMFRKEEMRPDHPLANLMGTLNSQPRVQRVDLDRLRPADVERLVKSMLGGRMVPEGLLELLTRECEGNAFFVGEFLKALLDDQVLTVQAGEWRLQSRAFRWNSGSVAVPITIRDVVRRRLQQLSPAASELLRLCSVIGREVPYPLLQQAWSRPEDELLETAEQLIVGHLLVEVPRRDSVAFYHAQICEVVQEDMPQLRRRALHRRVGEAMEKWARPVDDPPYFELARHFTVAQMPERAVPYLLQAADAAFHAYAYEKARDCLEQVMSQGESAGLDNAQLLAAEEKRAQCLLLSGEHRLAQQAYADLEKRTTGTERAAILRRLGRACEALGEHDRALACYHDGLAALGERLRLRTWPSLLDAITQFRQVRKGRKKSLDVHETNRLTELRRLYDQMIQTYYFAAVEERQAQGLELALRHLKVSLTLGLAPDIAQAYVTAAFILQHVALARGEARAFLEQALQHARDLPESSSRCRLLREVGYCLLVGGDLQQAITLLEESASIARRLNDVLGLIPSTAMLGMALWIQGDMSRSVEMVQISLARARTTENATFVVLSYIRLARVAMVRDQLELAAERRKQATAAALPGWGQATLPVLLLNYVQADLLAAQGHHDEAMPQLEKARQGFTEGGISRYDRLQVNFDTGMNWLDYLEQGAPPAEALAAATAIVEETRPLADVSYLKGLSLIMDGRLQAALHRTELARDCFQEAATLLRAADCPRLLAQCLVVGGRSLHQSAWLAEGVALAEQHGYGRLLRDYCGVR